jgi:hypothetical protein
MKLALLLLPVVCLVWSGCGNESKPPAKAGENPMSAPADYLGAVNKAQKAAVKTLGTASLDQAIKVFFEQEARYPKSLDELVTSGTLQKLPAAPNGMKFDYDPATGQVKTVPQK